MDISLTNDAISAIAAVLAIIVIAKAFRRR